jgi:hypothetical protein
MTKQLDKMFGKGFGGSITKPKEAKKCSKSKCKRKIKFM